jgi:phosphonate transport system permease protein
MREAELQMGGHPAKRVADWHLPAPYDWRAALAVLLVALALIWSGQRMEVGKMLGLTGGAVLSAVGLQEESQVGRGLGRMFGQLFPFVIEDRRELARLTGIDRDNLPMFTRIETVEVTTFRMNPETLQAEPQTDLKEYLVHPFRSSCRCRWRFTARATIPPTALPIPPVAALSAFCAPCPS